MGQSDSTLRACFQFLGSRPRPPGPDGGGTVRLLLEQAPSRTLDPEQRGFLDQTAKMAAASGSIAASEERLERHCQKIEARIRQHRGEALRLGQEGERAAALKQLRLMKAYQRSAKRNDELSFNMKQVQINMEDFSATSDVVLGLKNAAQAMDVAGAAINIEKVDQLLEALSSHIENSIVMQRAISDNKSLEPVDAEGLPLDDELLEKELDELMGLAGRKHPSPPPQPVELDREDPELVRKLEESWQAATIPPQPAAKRAPRQQQQQPAKRVPLAL